MLSCSTKFSERLPSTILLDCTTSTRNFLILIKTSLKILNLQVRCIIEAKNYKNFQILAVLYLSAAVVEVEWILTNTSYRTSAQVAELWFWLVVNYLRALLHIFSSVLIMLVSFEVHYYKFY